MERNGEEEQYMQPVGVKEDSVGQVTHEQMIEELENDVKAYTKALENAKKDLKIYEDQFKLDEKIWEILEKPGSLVSLDPKYAYEKDPDFIKVREEKQKIQNKEDRALALGKIEGIKYSIEENKKNIQKAKDKLAKFKGDEE
jgi:hypothetical protein